ncbi:hypothetical protein OUZ56_022842 [Daphnia magna]|uniref:Uncharacterized protein n=1 Tax=Daphnia magna TaxID=35525 RepID=A0ABR0AXP5_9CRUS|nr:hypothetical protein OUZ56_022842 [Daphnia magna]
MKMKQTSRFYFEGDVPVLSQETSETGRIASPSQLAIAQTNSIGPRLTRVDVFLCLRSECISVHQLADDDNELKSEVETKFCSRLNEDHVAIAFIRRTL